MEELSSQVNSLLSEKASLENRTSLLEKVMKMKEEGALAGYGPVSSPHASQLYAWHALMRTHS